YQPPVRLPVRRQPSRQQQVRRRRALGARRQPLDPWGSGAMFIPFKDDNPLVTVRYQFVTLAILIINIAVFVAFQGALTGSMSEGQILSYGLVPAVLFGSADLVGSL